MSLSSVDNVLTVGVGKGKPKCTPNSSRRTRWRLGFRQSRLRVRHWQRHPLNSPGIVPLELRVVGSGIWSIVGCSATKSRRTRVVLHSRASDGVRAGVRLRRVGSECVLRVDTSREVPLPHLLEWPGFESYI